jgi:hypothetical protein
VLLLFLKNQSKPPAKAKFSNAFLLAARKSIFLAKSKIDLYLASFLFSTIVQRLAHTNTFYAPIPKRTA